MMRTLAKASVLGASVLLGACGDAATPSSCKVDPSVDVAASTGTNQVQMVINGTILPTSKYEYSTDLDGDGTVDNALSNVVQVLFAQGFKNQADVTASVLTGEVVTLLSAKSSDATAQCAAAAGVTYYTGKPFPAGMLLDGGVMPDGGAAPDFTGSGAFATDPAFPAVEFLGNILDGSFSSNSPTTSAHPLTLKFSLALVGGSAPLQLPLNGAHINFKSTNGKVDSSCTVGSAANKACGAIQGSVKITDLKEQVLPPIAASLTLQVQADHTSMVETLFDLGGCTDANGTTAVAGDFIITACELANAPLIQHLLAADVQIFDRMGNYKPVPKGPNKDSLSIGIGFTAVPGKITVSP